MPLIGGTAFILAGEWSNGGTLGQMSVPGKLLAGFFQAVMPRTAGFNSVDIAEMNTGTWLGMDVLMFIGGGSAGTAGGIKITTFFLLLFVILSEVRAEQDSIAFNRRIPASAQRQALTVALLGVAAVVGPAVLFTITTRFSLDQVLFEIVSAFGTVGLSTGITADLRAPHQLILAVLMFIGRIGPHHVRNSPGAAELTTSVPIPGGTARHRLILETRTRHLKRIHLCPK